MRYTLLLLLPSFWMLPTFLLAQSALVAPDTLLKEDFTTDPSDKMLQFPEGNDLQWINYDQDNRATFDNAYPKNWFWDIDNADGVENGVFFSTSFLQSEFVRNRNWLISSPIHIPDTSYWLCWRSAPFQGPLYMDGYKVLISAKSNKTADLRDTIFRAAEMRTPPPANSDLLDLNNYTFTTGYIHANGFTNTNYYYTVQDTLPDGEIERIYWCRLEPHSVSLSKYAGQTIYIAFLHDSQNDFLLQLDDIVVSNERMVGVANMHHLLYFKILQNPVRDMAYLTWKLDVAMDCHLRIFNSSGQLMATQHNGRQEEGSWQIDLGAFPAGTYHCVLQTENGVVSKRLVRL